MYIIFWTFCDEKQFAKFLSLALSGERHKGRSWDQQSLFRHQGQGVEVNTANKKQSSLDQLQYIFFGPVQVFIVQCTKIDFRDNTPCQSYLFICLFLYFWEGPVPTKWLNVFGCMFVCLFTCWKGKAGRKYGGKKKTHPAISNQLARYYFFPFWFLVWLHLDSSIGNLRVFWCKSFHSFRHRTKKTWRHTLERGTSWPTFSFLLGGCHAI